MINSEEYSDLQQQMNEILADENKNRNIGVINNLNKDINNLNKDLKYEIGRKLHYKNRCFNAEKSLTEKYRKLKEKS